MPILIPPFAPIPDITPLANPVRRARKGEKRGSEVNTPVKPAAELWIHYETQFRFSNLWTLDSPRPYWDGAITKENLADAIANKTPKWLGPGGEVKPKEKLAGGQMVWEEQQYGNAAVSRLPCDIAQHDEEDETTPPTKKEKLTMVRVSSRILSAKGEGLIWIPLDGSYSDSLSKVKFSWKRTDKKPFQPPPMPGDHSSHQWGVRGSMELYTDPFGVNKHAGSYKSIAMWQDWKDRKRYVSDSCFLPIGIYAGFPTPMDRHKSIADRKDSPEINVCAEWVSVRGGGDNQDKVDPHMIRQSKNLADWDWFTGWWEEKVHGWRQKWAQSSKLTPNIFFHPGERPDQFQGCQSFGNAEHQREWGFRKKEDTRQALLEIFEKIGIKNFATKGEYPNRKKWFIINVTAAEDAVADDGWKRQLSSFWLPLPV